MSTTVFITNQSFGVFTYTPPVLLACLLMSPIQIQEPVLDTAHFEWSLDSLKLPLGNRMICMLNT